MPLLSYTYMLCMGKQVICRCRFIFTQKYRLSFLLTNHSTNIFFLTSCITYFIVKPDMYCLQKLYMIFKANKCTLWQCTSLSPQSKAQLRTLHTIVSMKSSYFCGILMHNTPCFLYSAVCCLPFAWTMRCARTIFSRLILLGKHYSVVWEKTIDTSTFLYML